MAQFKGTERYVATRELEVAVNAAVALERPLLIKGEPGTGKTVLAQEIAKALSGAELKGIWESLGAEAGGQSPEDMGKFVDAEIAKWAKVVKDSGAKLD